MFLWVIIELILNQSSTAISPKFMQCKGYYISNEFDVDKLVKSLIKQGFEPQCFDDVVHITHNLNSYDSDILYFPFGCVVAFKKKEDDLIDFILKSLSEQVDISQKKYKDHDFVRHHTDYVNYSVNPVISDDNQFHQAYNQMHKAYNQLHNTQHVSEQESEKNPNEDRMKNAKNPGGYIDLDKNEVSVTEDSIFAKLSIAYAVAQSVKLGSLEDSCNQLIKNTTPIQQELANKGSVSLSKLSIAKSMGELFRERYLVNLSSEVLDTPEFFWRRPKYEHLYLITANFQDIETRQKILNKKLDIIQDLYSILSQELNHINSSRLEIIVILLIAIEVVIGLSHTKIFSFLFV